MKKYYLLLVLVLTVCFAAFDLTNLWILGKHYTPFIFNGTTAAQQSDEAQGYAPYMQHFAARGHTPYEVDVIEAQHLTNNYSYLYAYLTGFLLQVFKDGRYVWLLVHTLFPVLAGVLLYYLISREVKDVLVALTLVFVLCLVSFGIRNFLGFGTGAALQPLELSRAFSPAISFPHFLLVVIGLYRVLIQQKVNLTLVFTGIGLGLLVYAYYFYWTVAFVCIGGLCLYFALTKKWAIFKALAFVLLIGVCVAGQYFYNVFTNLLAPQDFPLTNRFVTFTHQPYYLPLLLSILGVMACKFAYKKHSPLEFLLYSLLVNTFFCFNLHILTGINAQHTHYWGRIIIPFGMLYIAILSTGYISKNLSSKQLQYFHATLVVLSVLIVVRSLHRQIVAAQVISPFADMRQPLYDILSYTQNNFAKEQVIGSTQTYCIGITPSITKHWLFVPNAVRTNVANAEIIFRYLIMAKIEHKAWQRISEVFASKFPTHYQNAASYLPYQLTLRRKPIIEANNRQYADSLKKIYDSIDIAKELSTRQLDLIITDEASSQQIHLPNNFTTQVLYRKENWVLLQVIRVNE